MIRLRALLRRKRCHLLALGIAGFLGLAVAWAHAGGEEHMTGGEMGGPASICLGVIEAGLGLLAAIVVFKHVPRKRPPRATRSHARLLRRAPKALPIHPRAGPVLLQVFLC